MRRMYSKPQLLEAVEQEAEVNGLKAFENIVDKDGHKRFDKGEITLTDNVPEGITKTFGKWSLSGTHLLIVLCLECANGTVVNDNIILSNVSFPKWIWDKIVPIANTVIAFGTYTAYDTSFQTQSFNVRIAKTSTEGIIAMMKSGAVTLSSTKNVRITFDLYID